MKQILNKLNSYKILFFSNIFFVLFFISNFIFADDQVSTSGSIAAVENPLKKLMNGEDLTLSGILIIIINALVYIAIPFIVLAFMYAGFLFVTSLGDQGKLKKAKDAFLYTIVATFIILGANWALTLITDTTNAILK